MAYKYIPFIVAGVAIVAAALPAAYRLRSPWTVVAALVALAGVVTSLAGVLLMAVPHFISR